MAVNCNHPECYHNKDCRYGDLSRFTIRHCMICMAEMAESEGPQCNECDKVIVMRVS